MKILSRVLKGLIAAPFLLIYYVIFPSRYPGLDPNLGNDDTIELDHRGSPLGWGEDYTDEDMSKIMFDSHLG